MVVPVSRAASLTGIQTKQEMLSTTIKGEMVVNYGKAADKIQSNFVYLCLPDNVPPPPTTVIDDPEKTIVTVKQLPKTTVTKIYYDKADDTAPSKIKHETVSKESTYNIPSKDDDYVMIDWVLVPDIIPEKPDYNKNYEEAEKNKIEQGNTPTTITPDKWNTPDKELVIKYVKKQSEEKKDSLFLPEKRISWLKSLEDIGGRPTIIFSWSDNNHEETHYCGSKKCSGHRCVLIKKSVYIILAEKQVYIGFFMRIHHTHYQI